MPDYKMKGLLDILRVPPGKKIDLQKDYDPDFTGDWVEKEDADEAIAEGVERLAKLQDKLYAQNNYAVLLIIQAPDAAGKDSVIRHVMSGVNPQGVIVTSFKAPAGEELNHDYLWRHFKATPPRGHIGIHNRSHYEEVIVVRVHPKILAGQKLPPALKDDDIWKRRYEEINNFEKYLVDNGVVVVKVFLNVSKKAQKERFLERIEMPEKNWKFSAGDVDERQYWDEYQKAYEDMLNHTSTEWAPWYVVPAGRQWFSRVAVSRLLCHTLEKLDLDYPSLTAEQKQALLVCKARLESEND